MTTFKKGDRVVCVDASAAGTVQALVDGAEYVVAAVRPDGLLQVVDFNGFLCASRFRLVESPSWSTTHKGRAYAIAQAFGITEAEAYGSDVGGHLDLLAARERGGR